LEHKCVLDSCRKMQDEGFSVAYLPVKQNGLLDLNDLEEEIQKNKNSTVLVSVMFVNNEIGVLQPIAEIGALCHKYDVFFPYRCSSSSWENSN